MNDAFQPSILQRNLNRIYDQGFASDFHEAFFQHSGFSNFGFWSEGITSAQAAAENLVLELLKPLEPLQGPVLDVACGQGGTTRTLANLIPPDQVHAINISQQQLKNAQKNAPECHFHLMSATQLEFDANSLAGILCVEAVFHFETRRRFLKEAWRVLKPGGWLVLSDVQFRFPPPERIIPPANHFRNLAQYRQIYLDAGFESPTLRSVMKPTWKSCRDALRKYALKRLLQSPSPQSLKEWSLNEVRCKLYDAVMQDYLLVSVYKPLA
ncbi:hypothetical protein COW36_13625 [bacterium (Candidatus Blackallbacteria) CG17_big_fil_post_rev_8_21_14_2_50_48_46]|uniref:Methyltransferase type 11 domain-containing protein n=1 Tax=bacterium (Candidatus Blackallbacteria) CG17_big_fil_post_rev_8_21_14_2_50_48_46 TaxID=2014261 RepID=A0A2M7G4E0_9BACT|nr:MAG: hypothetical protein COW64_22245 [bacterium (Candidatus Blackallbacteria) CG18_big_fil_WC_8_21_14_2_50_49_26]PIW16364.1 MAG: hypothetical protein COW36_13625 [bacterium (Candidatus Blackallbacteria) CG17_big_fil_post_rev_8_21_14_2_50_48_46]PIW45378.1 MAG: hypothetical protein COW20_20860 [bacterium (Candidatus Blackallbacteria) CG13_big_fil_rev_8_21_14_2_50_49_14]